jgi:hypothetical protein
MLKTAIKRVPGAKQLAGILGLTPSPTDDRAFLLAMLPEDSVGAEIGVHLGDFSQRLLDVVSPRELYLIDPWEHFTGETYDSAWYGGKARQGQVEMDARLAQVFERFEHSIAAGQVHIERGYSTAVLEKFPDRYFDWVYIDGNHLYGFVKKDLEVASRKTRPGGFITGDDYGEGGWWQGGVKRAVDEFAAERSAELLEIRSRQFVFRNT